MARFKVYLLWNIRSDISVSMNFLLDFPLPYPNIFTGSSLITVSATITSKVPNGSHDPFLVEDV